MELEGIGIKRFRDWVKEIDWLGSIPVIFMHLTCFLAFWTGVSWAAFIIFLVTLSVRIFGITGG